MNVAETVAELEKVAEGLQQQGISVGPLNSAIAELRQHVDNIQKIEENLAAVREEVVHPIRAELIAGRAAGRASIWGFWIGVISLLVSIGLAWYPSFSRAARTASNCSCPSGIGSGSSNVLPRPGAVELAAAATADRAPIASRTTPRSPLDDVNSRLWAIEWLLLFAGPTNASAGEIELPQVRPTPIGELGGAEVSLEYWPGDWQDGRYEASVIVFQAGRPVAPRVFGPTFVQAGGKTGLRPHYPEKISVQEGDHFRIGRLGIYVLRLQSSSPGPRLSGDAKDAAIIKVLVDGQ